MKKKIELLKYNHVETSNDSFLHDLQENEPPIKRIIKEDLLKAIIFTVFCTLSKVKGMNINMKKMKMLYNTIMFMPTAITLICLNYIPDRIPTHYSLTNQADRWGSKYELLAFPILVIGFGIFMRMLANYHKKHEKLGTNNEQVCLTSGIVCMILFSFLNYYFLYLGGKSIEDASVFVLDLEQIIFGMLGIAMIIIGNILPKARMNSFTGFRTRWSMQNEKTWEKSQLFGGISFLIAGLIILVISFVTKSINCMILSLACFWIVIIIDFCYTYWIAKKMDKKNEK